MLLGNTKEPLLSSIVSSSTVFVSYIYWSFAYNDTITKIQQCSNIMSKCNPLIN